MDDFDDVLRSAAQDLRVETDNLTPPEFTPRSSSVGPFAAGIAVAVLAIAGVFGLRTLLQDGGNEDLEAVAPPETTITTSTTNATSTTGTSDGADGGPVSELTLPPPMPLDLQNAVQHGDPVALTETTSSSLPAGPGTEWTEPDFGTSIVQVTDAPVGGTITPVYSTSQTFNPSGSLVILYQQGEGHELYDGNTLAPLRELSIVSDDVYNFSWHPTQESLIYFSDWDGGESNRLIELDVRTGARRVAETFEACDRIGQGRGIGSTANGTGVMGLLCTQADGEHWMTYNLLTGEVVISELVDQGETAPTSASPDGTLFAAITDTAIRVLDGDLQPTPQDPIIVRADAQAVTIGGADAHPLALVTLTGDRESNGLVIAFDLVTGDRRSLLDDSTGSQAVGNGQLSTTLSAGVVAAVTRAADSGAGAPYQGEILLVDTGPDVTIYRLGRHRMSFDLGFGFEWGSTPFIALDPLGRYVLFSTDFGSGTAVNTFAVQLDR